MPLGGEVDLGPGHSVLGGDPASPQKGHSPPPFSPSLLLPNGWMDQDASWAARQWYRLLLLAVYGLATVHALLCIVSGDDSAVFCFLFMVTLAFDLDLRTRARFLYSAPNRQVSSSYI